MSAVAPYPAGLCVVATAAALSSRRWKTAIIAALAAIVASAGWVLLVGFGPCME